MDSANGSYIKIPFDGKIMLQNGQTFKLGDVSIDIVICQKFKMIKYLRKNRYAIL